MRTIIPRFPAPGSQRVKAETSKEKCFDQPFSTGHYYVFLTNCLTRFLQLFMVKYTYDLSNRHPPRTYYRLPHPG